MARPSKRTLPVNLLLEGRRCLVVGGGAVAFRKVTHLLDAGANVEVISPELAPEIESLAAAGRVRHAARPFEEEDVDDAVLAFAATSDPEVNRQVLAACRARRVLGCSVDKLWSEGDFLTPATLRRDELTVAVATGGVSCRRSRMIKESLLRHIDAVNASEIIVIGASHEQMCLEDREPFHLAGERLSHAGALLSHVWGIHEFAILNTCNRIEVHAVAANHVEVRCLIEQILDFHNLADCQYYTLTGYDAFRHTSMLLAGLLSQMPGENHIVAQTKAAYSDADKAGWAGSMMREWLGFALHTAKHIRNKTQPLLRHAEIEDLCMDYVGRECREQIERGVLVMGCGLVGRGIVHRVRNQYPDVPITWCYHETMPARFNDPKHRMQIHALTDLPRVLPSVHLVVCATGSPAHLLNASHAEFMDRGHPVTIVDLAMPRNVDPALDNAKAGIHVVDLEDLKHWYQREAADMERAMAAATEVVREHAPLWQKLVEGFVNSA